MFAENKFLHDLVMCQKRQMYRLRNGLAPLKSLDLAIADYYNKIYGNPLLREQDHEDNQRAANEDDSQDP